MRIQPPKEKPQTVSTPQEKTHNVQQPDRVKNQSSHPKEGNKYIVSIQKQKYKMFHVSSYRRNNYHIVQPLDEKEYNVSTFERA